MRRRFLAMALAAAMVFSSVSNLTINTITAVAAEEAATEAVEAKTTIGASDCSSAFYAEHSDFYEIKEGKTITINFDVKGKPNEEGTAVAYNWCSYLLAFTNVFNNTHDLAVLRPDWYTFGNKKYTATDNKNGDNTVATDATAVTKESGPNWETYGAMMLDANVTMTISRENNKVTADAVFTSNKDKSVETNRMKYSFTLDKTDAASPFYAYLSMEQACITIKEAPAGYSADGKGSVTKAVVKNVVDPTATSPAATSPVEAKTTIGASDCSSAFYAEHGDFYEIKEGKTITINFDVKGKPNEEGTAVAYNWCSYLLAFTNVFNNTHDLAVLRPDWYTFGNKKYTALNDKMDNNTVATDATAVTKESGPNWDTYGAMMLDANVTMTISRENNKVTADAVFTSNKDKSVETNRMKYSFTLDKTDAASPFYAYLSMEGACITIKEAPAGYSADGTGSVTKAVVKNGVDPTATSPAATSPTPTMMPTTPSAATIAPTQTTLSNPKTDRNGVTTWDCIYFGNYWQNDTNGDGTADQNDTKEPIKWRVLSVDGDDAFLLADQNLDSQPYSKGNKDVTWETCTLRTWLNGTFLSNAFNLEEQAAIKSTTVVNDDNPEFETEGGNNTTDQVYLLSIAEASTMAYGFNEDFECYSKTREARNTAYAKACGAYTFTETQYEGNGYWWVRSPGCWSSYASYVIGYGCGYNSGTSAGNSFPAVRPVLHLNLSSSTLWSYAGKVTSNREDDISPTPATSTPTAPTTVPTVAPTASAPLPTATQSFTQPKQSTAPTVKPTLTPTSAPTPTVNTQMETSDIPSVQLKSLKASGKGKAKVTWKKTDEISGYRLQYAQDKKFKKKAKTKLLAAKKTSVTLTGLKKKKTYYVRIRAYVLADGEKEYGKWSNVKKVKIKQ